MYQQLFIGAVVTLGVFKLTDWMIFKWITRHHVETMASYDGQSYFVLPTKHQTQAANTLARIKHQIILVINQIAADVQTETIPFMKRGMARLVSRFQPDFSDLLLIELPASNPKHLAINRNKGDIIFLCLRQARNQPTIGQLQNILYIALHEIAHCMTADFEPTRNGVSIHGPQFQRYEQYVFSVGERLGLLNPSSIRGNRHCGGLIP